MPIFPHCAFYNEQALDSGLMMDYSWIWNVLEYPSGIVTVTQVKEDEQEFTDNYNDGWTKILN